MLRNCLLCLLCFPFMGLAQDADESLFSATTATAKSSQIQEYYHDYLGRYGQDQLLSACESALETHGDNHEEYAAKLLNQLARNYQLLYQLDEAKNYYQQVLDTEFTPDYYAKGMIASREKLVALAGLRDVAILDEDYKLALAYQQRYTQKLLEEGRELFLQNQVKNDKILAFCYQKAGQSEKAIDCLSPYAFGKGVHAGGGIDKQMVDQLAELLLSKYPKKPLRKLLPIIHSQIYAETIQKETRFYLKIFDNKIYFPKDAYQYSAKVKNGQVVETEAIAYYQRKLCNSYFFQRLVNLL